MKITITLEVPEGTSITTSNDQEYLSHEDHPKYLKDCEMTTRKVDTGMRINNKPLVRGMTPLKESHLIEIESLKDMISRLDAQNRKLTEQIRDGDKALRVFQNWALNATKPFPTDVNPTTIPSESSPVKPTKVEIAPRSFHCPSCKDVFHVATLQSQTPCPQCQTPMDLDSAPRDDTNSIPCITCGTIYDKTKGGKFGTCPDCTTVRCPTCKNPASLAEMQGGPKCKTCRGGI
jgi:DNA-directed RNA polymerase subunit RPC12/RpoP